MYSCACSLSSNPIDLSTVITCECSQKYGRTALLWAIYILFFFLNVSTLIGDVCACVYICMH
jgi:hypothetical protein